MKITFKEHGHSYKTYNFGYCVYAEGEKEDTLSKIYESGFLPYSADLKKNNIYYFSRSCRLPLKDFLITSENKRVLKKFDGTFVKEKIKAKSLIHDDTFLSFCNTYFEKRHGSGIFTKERLVHILSYFDDSFVIKYSLGDKPVAYVLENGDGDMGHFWFSFYDLDFAFQSLGMWLMLDCIIQAKKDKLKYYYLGTVYGEKALYKTNLKPLEYWDGSCWVCDTNTLKRLARTDNQREFDIV